MVSWTNDELDRIGRADELDIAPLRQDGTLRKPVTIWVVRHGDSLYVRSGYGRAAAWYRGIQVRREGCIKAGGIEKDVIFEDADHTFDDRSMLHTAASIIAMAHITSALWLLRRPAPRRSSSYRAHLGLSRIDHC